MPPVDGTYAPQSPDLSSFLSSSSLSSTPAKPQQQSSTSSYTPRSPRLPDFTSPQQSALGIQPSSSGYQVPQSARQYQGFGDRDYQRRHSSYLPPIPDLPSSHNFGLVQGQQTQSQYTSPSYQAPTDYSQLRSSREAYSRNSYTLPQQALTYQPPAPIPFQQSFPHQQQYAPPQIAAESTHTDMSTRVKRERAVKGGISQDVPAHLGVSQGIEVKTKFPVARIKRIMQADEEVGKVAQVTPVAVCTSPLHPIPPSCIRKRQNTN